jgi:hypothetical protein
MNSYTFHFGSFELCVKKVKRLAFPRYGGRHEQQDWQLQHATDLRRQKWNGSISLGLGDASPKDASVPKTIIDTPGESLSPRTFRDAGFLTASEAMYA